MASRWCPLLASRLGMLLSCLLAELKDVWSVNILLLFSFSHLVHLSLHVRTKQLVALSAEGRFLSRYYQFGVPGILEPSGCFQKVWVKAGQGGGRIFVSFLCAEVGDSCAWFLLVSKEAMSCGAPKCTYSFMMLCSGVLGLWEENLISNAGKYGYNIGRNQDRWRLKPSLDEILFLYFICKDVFKLIVILLTDK